MGFDAFRDWAFMGLLTGSLFLLYNLIVSFRSDIKELSNAIFTLKDELSKSSAQLLVQDAKIEVCRTEHAREIISLRLDIEEIKKQLTQLKFDE